MRAARTLGLTAFAKACSRFARLRTLPAVLNAEWPPPCSGVLLLVWLPPVLLLLLLLLLGMPPPPLLLLGMSTGGGGGGELGGEIGASVAKPTWQGALRCVDGFRCQMNNRPAVRGADGSGGSEQGGPPVIGPEPPRAARRVL